MTSPNAPSDGAEAGDDSDHQKRLASRGPSRATEHARTSDSPQRVREAKGGRREQAERSAREAIDASVRAFWWAEDSAAEAAQHKLMHRIGRWTRRTLGCHLRFTGSNPTSTSARSGSPTRRWVSRSDTSRIRSARFVAMSFPECPHIRGRSYWVRGGIGQSGHCPVCLSENDCAHRSDRLYRVSVVSIVTSGEVREVSWVDRPGVPEARILSLPIDTQRLVAHLPSEFRVGMPVNCDFCLLPCEGVEEPFADLTAGLATSDTE